jgi:hypothetical protein
MGGSKEVVRYSLIDLPLTVKKYIFVPTIIRKQYVIIYVNM